MRARFPRWLLLALLLTCSLSPARSQEATSPEPSSEQPMVPLSICEAKLRELETISIEKLTALSTSFEERLRSACEAAAAEAVKPVLLALDSAGRAWRRWRIVAAVELVAVVVLGVVVAVRR